MAVGPPIYKHVNNIISMKQIFYPSLAAVVVVAATGCSHHSVSDSDQVPEVAVAEATSDSIVLYKVYPGTLSANDDVDVVARVNGTITSCSFNGGDLVTKGQVLFTIEDTKYRDALQQAEAQLATARSANDYATRQYAAMKKALESDAVSQMEVLQAKNSMEQSAAQIKEAQAALSVARTNLNYCIVRAPMTGHITTNVLSVGAFVDGEAAPAKLATIYSDDVLNAKFFIEDASYLRMFANQQNRAEIENMPVPVSFNERLPHAYEGVLSYMAPEVDPSTGTLLVYAKVKNQYGELRDGMYAEIRLPYRVDPKAVLVKDAALSTDQLGKYLYVVNDSDKVVYTPVEVGDLYHDTLRVISSGIRPGEKYVTKALLKVRDGMTVKPVM